MDNDVDYFRLELTAARRLVIGLRRLNLDADLWLENEHGAALDSSKNLFTTDETIARTLLPGLYFARIAAQDTGRNDYIFRYSTEDADSLKVAELEEQADSLEVEQQEQRTRCDGHSPPAPSIPDSPAPPEPEPTASTGRGCENRLSIESSYLERRDPETNRYNRYVRVSFTVKILEAPDYSGRIWVTDCSGQALPTHVVPADISSSGQQETYEQDRAIQGGYNVQTFYVDFAPVAFKGHIDLRPADGRVCRARASLVHCQ